MYHEDNEIKFHEDDQCLTCKYHPSQSIDKICPLLEALAFRLAFLDGDVAVVNCGFYEVFERHLRLVTDNTEATNDGPDIQSV